MMRGFKVASLFLGAVCSVLLPARGHAQVQAPAPPWPVTQPRLQPGTPFQPPAQFRPSRLQMLQMLEMQEKMILSNPSIPEPDRQRMLKTLKTARESLAGGVHIGPGGSVSGMAPGAAPAVGVMPPNWPSGAAPAVGVMPPNWPAGAAPAVGVMPPNWPAGGVPFPGVVQETPLGLARFAFEDALPRLYGATIGYKASAPGVPDHVRAMLGRTRGASEPLRFRRRVRGRTTEALLSLGSDPCRQLLEKMARGSRARSRVQAMLALGGVREAWALPLLKEGLASGEAKLRQAAIASMAGSANLEAAALIRHARKSEDPTLRHLARLFPEGKTVPAVRFLPGPAGPDCLGEPPGAAGASGPDALVAAGRDAEEAVALVEAALSRVDATASPAGNSASGQVVEQQEAIPLGATFVSDGLPRIPDAASTVNDLAVLLDVLLSEHPGEAPPILRKLLSSRHVAFKLLAAFELGRLGSSEPLQELKSLMAAEVEWDPRVMVAVLLAALGDGSGRQLLEDAFEADHLVARAIVDGRLKSDAAMTAAELLQDHLWATGVDEVPGESRFYGDASLGGRVAAALACLDAERMGRIAEQWASSPTVGQRVVAAQVLAVTAGRPGSLTALRALLEAPEREVARTAASVAASRGVTALAESVIRAQAGDPGSSTMLTSLVSLSPAAGASAAAAVLAAGDSSAPAMFVARNILARSGNSHVRDEAREAFEFDVGRARLEASEVMAVMGDREGREYALSWLRKKLSPSTPPAELGAALAAWDRWRPGELVPQLESLLESPVQEVVGSVLPVLIDAGVPVALRRLEALARKTGGSTETRCVAAAALLERTLGVGR